MFYQTTTYGQDKDHFALPHPLYLNRETVLKLLHDHSSLARGLFPGRTLASHAASATTTIFKYKIFWTQFTYEITNLPDGVSIPEKPMGDMRSEVRWTVAGPDPEANRSSRMSTAKYHLEEAYIVSCAEITARFCRFLCSGHPLRLGLMNYLNGIAREETRLMIETDTPKFPRLERKPAVDKFKAD